MILWHDGARPPAEQMARDQALLARAERDPEAEPVLRVFGFSPPGITLGYAQRPERELDLERCARDGVPWAVRPTGGRAIFHAEEWTYALAARLDDPRWGGSLEHAYRSIGELLVRALRRLGVPAELADARALHRRGAARAPAGGGAGEGRPAAPAAPCFASTARHEIVLGGRKLVGSAQRRTARALLQQGSIVLGGGHRRLADYLAIPEAGRAAVRARLAASVAAAGDQVGAGAPSALLVEALAAELGPELEVLGEPAFDARWGRGLAGAAGPLAGGGIP